MSIFSIPLPDPETSGHAVHMRMPAPTSILFRARLALASIPPDDTRNFILAVTGSFTDTMLDKNLSGHANHSTDGRPMQGKLAILNYGDTIKAVRTAKDRHLTIIIEEDVYWSSDTAVALSAAVLRATTDLIFISDRNVPDRLRKLMETLRPERPIEEVRLEGTIPTLPALQPHFEGNLQEWVSTCADEITVAVRQGKHALILCERDTGKQIQQEVNKRKAALDEPPGYLHVVNTDAKYLLERAKDASHPHYFIVSAAEPLAVKFESLGLVMLPPSLHRHVFDIATGHVIQSTNHTSLDEKQLAVKHALLSTLPAAEVKVFTPVTDKLPASPPARFKNEQLFDFCFRFVATFDVENAQQKMGMLNSLGMDAVAFKEAFRRLQISGCFSRNIAAIIDPGTAHFISVADNNTRVARFLASASNLDEHLKRATARIAALLVVSEPRPVIARRSPVDLALAHEMARNLAAVLDIPAHIYTQGDVWCWLAFWTMWDGINAINPANLPPGRRCVLHSDFVMDQHSADVVRTKARIMEQLLGLAPGHSFLRLSEEQCRRIVVNMMRAWHDQLVYVKSDAVTNDMVTDFASRVEVRIDDQPWHAVDANGSPLRPSVIVVRTFKVLNEINGTTLICGEANLMKDLAPLLYGPPGETLRQRLEKGC